MKNTTMYEPMRLSELIDALQYQLGAEGDTVVYVSVSPGAPRQLVYDVAIGRGITEIIAWDTEKGEPIK